MAKPNADTPLYYETRDQLFGELGEACAPGKHEITPTGVEFRFPQLPVDFPQRLDEYHPTLVDILRAKAVIRSLIRQWKHRFGR